MWSRREFLLFCGSALPIPFLERVRRIEGLHVFGETPRGAPSARPAWPAPSALPAWFDGARVQGLTRLPPSWANRPVYQHAGAAAKALGATVLTRHIKTDADASLWLPGGLLTPDGSARVRQMVDEARTSGVRLILYYWDIGDDGFADQHPDAVCKQPNGRDSVHRVRGTEIDMTTPAYVEMVGERLEQMAAMGVDGFYFDYLHVPATGCLDTSLQREYEQRMGQPLKPRRYTDADPDYHAFLRFVAERVTATFQQWKTRVQQQRPETLFIISTTYLPSLISNRMNSELAGVSDSAKSEIYLAVRPQMNLNVFSARNAVSEPPPDDRMALGFCYLRDAAGGAAGGGRPPHVWAPGFTRAADYEPATAAVLAFGGIAAVDIPEALLAGGSGVADAQRIGIPAAFALGKRLSPHLGGTVPIRWLAVLVSERARDARGVDFQRAWREVLWPETGAFGAGLRAGVPTGTIDDDGLAASALEGVRVLFVSDAGVLTDAQQNAVNAFVSRGGTVIRQRSEWDWAGDAAGAARGLRAVLDPLLPAAPVLVTAQGGTPYASAFVARDGSRTVVGVTTAFSGFALTGGQEVPGAVENPAPLTGLRITVRSGRAITDATELATGAALTIQRNGDAYTVVLPPTPRYAFVSFA